MKQIDIKLNYKRHANILHKNMTGHQWYQYLELMYGRNIDGSINIPLWENIFRKIDESCERYCFLINEIEQTQKLLTKYKKELIDLK